MVRINDRGPFAKSRIIDLSRAAAFQLGMMDGGVAQVTLEVLGTPTVELQRSPNAAEKRPTVLESPGAAQ